MKKSSAHDESKKIIDVSLNNLLTFLGILLILLSYLLNNYNIQNSKNNTSKNNSQKSLKEERINKTTEGDKNNEIINPLPVDTSFTAQSYLVFDESSKEIVGGKNINKKMPIASLTKLATALVSIEKFPLDLQLTVPQKCIGLEGNNVGLKLNERFYVEDLLYGLLLRSASDAACVLYQNYPGGMSVFIKDMNNLAKSLNMNNTNFVNPIGLDHPNHYSTALDLLKLINHYKKVETLKIISGTRDYTLKSLNSNSVYYILNTNELLHKIPGTVGYKTGYTTKAKECLIYGYNNQNKKVIIIALGSSNRFYDTKNLLDIYLSKVSSPR